MSPISGVRSNPDRRGCVPGDQSWWSGPVRSVFSESVPSENNDPFTRTARLHRGFSCGRVGLPYAHNPPGVNVA